MVLLCLCAIGVFAVISGHMAVTAVALIEAGAVLGFLRFNTHPAQIFMGDSGSQMLGFSVGTLALMVTQGETTALSAALPLLLLGIPIMDTAAVMLTRIRAGRSPFSADRNHLHHRLLALGFAHGEAVLTIYILQVGVVLLAYFLRFAADLTVVLVFCAFTAAVLGALRWATVSGWRAGQRAGFLRIRHYVGRFQSPERITHLAVVVMTASLAVYAATVLAASRHISVDLGLICFGMLVALLILSRWRAERSLQWFVRAAAYISVVTLVYLDQTMYEKPAVITTLSWVLVALTGAAALVRFGLSSTRRFELTTLDVIVIFIALFLPNLSGSLNLPADLPGGVAKALILLYVVEMLLAAELTRLLPRVFVGITLATIAGRALIVIGT
jgi:UDP-GlcNAc:undecaprenyl-phosphate/decaprenyl-phosphate GlcNAc-1-phosphate transferase